MKPGVVACKRYFNKNRDAINARRRVRRAAVPPEIVNAKYAAHRDSLLYRLTRSTAWPIKVREEQRS